MEILVFILIIAFLIFIFHKPGRKPQKGLNAEKPSNKLRVKSFTGDEQYMVDINALSCTCADFYDRRSNYDRSDPRRLCKHLIRTLLEEGQLPPSLAQYEEKLQGIEEQGRGFPITKKLVNPTIDGRKYEIWLCDPDNISDPKYAWCDVYDGPDRFAYNLIENRWSYKMAPENGNGVIRFIHNEMGLPEPDVRYTIKRGNKRSNPTP